MTVLSKKPLPTLQDVADEARVSTATVSRCLNEPDKVSQKTRERVLKAVDKLHYTPNFGARAIAANRTGTFGAVIPTMENAIFARGIEAFQKALLERNATMLVASSNYDPEQEAAQIKTLVARGADGLLLIGFDRDPKILEFLVERELPVVFAWNCDQQNSHSFVGFDNRAASQRLVSEAIHLGHKSFAYVSAPTRMNDRARDRLEGARAAVREAGLDPDLISVIETDYSVNNGKQAMQKIIDNSKGKLPTLVICGNDVLAVGAIKGAKAAGLTVPDDISVVGFDDIEIASVIEPALTTVHVPHREMGRLAGETLLGLADQSLGVTRKVLETRIVIRDSLGPAKSPV